MTAITGLVLKNRSKFKKREIKKIPPIQSNDISIVIPVKDNQKGIDKLLESVFVSQISEFYPKEIIIVDNNEVMCTKINTKFLGKGIEIKLFHCKTKGPGNARNVGWKRAKGKWILFTDSDCIMTNSSIQEYIKSDNGSIGYAGNVKSIEKGPVSDYYDSQQILIPLQNEFEEPEYLITANCLVYHEALEKINGFNPKIRIAAGEDVDLGIRLRNYGKLTYCKKAIIMHNFDECIDDFKKRFIRYGKGNKIVSNIYNVDLSPEPFAPAVTNSTNNYLSGIQFHYLKKGYESE